MTKIDDFECVYNASGQLDAEMMKNLLESFGIHSIILGESAGSVYGLTVTPTGKVEVLVDKKDVQSAKDIIQRYESGELEE